MRVGYEKLIIGGVVHCSRSPIFSRKIVKFERTRPSWAPEKFRYIKILTRLPVIRDKIANFAFFLVKCDLSFDLFVIRDNIYVNAKAALALSETRTKNFFKTLTLVSS